jgi:hypothetical protein
VASSTESERPTGVPVETPPLLDSPTEAQPAPGIDGARGVSGRQDTQPVQPAGDVAPETSSFPGLPRQRLADDSGSSAAPFVPPAVAAAAPEVDAKPAIGSAQVVSVAAFGSRTSAAAFDPQAPQPLPERIRPLVGALIINAARVGLKLTLSCGRRVTVSCAGCGRLPASALASAGAAWSVVEAGLPTPGVLTADDSVALALADVLLGGDGRVAPRSPERVETSVLRRHLGRALSPLLEPLLPYGVRTIDLAEPPPEITPPELLGGAEMFAVRLTVELDSGVLPGVLVLALPYRTLFGTAGSADVPRDEKANRALAGVPVDLTVRFPATTLPAYDIAGLELGDVLRLEVAQPLVQGLVDGVRLLSGSLGRSGRRRAILVSELETGLEAGT